MHIKLFLKTIYHKLKRNNQNLVDAQLCGVPLRVLPGTVRDKADQDDAWWFYLAKHHNVIFDIGCNIGYTALLALIQNKDRTMVLVDPNPKALQNAAINIIENQVGNKVFYYSAFVSNHSNDLIRFYTVGSGAAGSMHSSHAKTAASMNSYMDVNTVTLDDLYNYYQLSPNLVKIDIEGAETMAMQASKKMANETKCTFFIEMHDVADLGMEAAGQVMLDWCKELNYRAWYLKTGTELIQAAIIKGRGKCHLLLMPEEKEYPIYLKGISQNSALPETI